MERSDGTQGIIFDLDGVLVDSEPVHLRACQEALARHGVRLTAEEYFSRYVGYPDEEIFAALLRPAEVEAALAAKLTRYFELVGAGLPAFPDALALLARAARMPLGLATGSSRGETALALQGLGIADRFNVIVVREDCVRSKPDPEPYLRATAGLRIPAERCVAVEDSPQGVRAAKAAGLRCLAVSHWCPAGRLAEADRVVATLDVVDPADPFEAGGADGR